jgi:hypothetical protein
MQNVLDLLLQAKKTVVLATQNNQVRSLFIQSSYPSAINNDSILVSCNMPENLLLRRWKDL